VIKAVMLEGVMADDVIFVGVKADVAIVDAATNDDATKPLG